MVLRIGMIAAAAATMTAAVPFGAAAEDGKAFLAKLAGDWAGSGRLVAAVGAEPEATSCRLSGAPTAAGVSITGSCDGAARGAKLAVVLRWSEPTGEVLGTFQGGAESGTANLSGRLSGNTLTLRVSSEGGGADRMVLTLSGAGQASLRLTGKAKDGKAVDFVSLGLRKA